MAPGSDDRHPPQPPSHTGTVPKTKVRNCVVPQEAVTPTRRDINSSNIASSSLDWVPVAAPEYNSRPNYSQSSRKTTNSRPDHDYSDLDTTITLESALQRFVPVRPQPRGLPLPMQPAAEQDDCQHPYHHTPNGVSPHANHAAAAVMIVNPTTPNTMTTNMSHPYNLTTNHVPSNTSRNNLNRSLHSSRNADMAGSNQSLSSQHTTSQHQTQPAARAATKTNNITSVYEQSQPAAQRVEVPHMNGGPGDSARSLGEALVSSCPDPASVERRLGQIREYIRVTSCLVDTMRNSEDEEVSENNSCERAAKFCKLLDQLALNNVPDLASNSHAHTNNYNDSGTRPMSVQSMGSGYSDNDLWQSELKAKMEVSQQRLAALQDQQKRLLKYQAEAKQHLADMQDCGAAHSRQSHDNALHSAADNIHAQNQLFGGSHPSSHRMYNANQIGVATTLPQTNHTSNVHSTTQGEGQDEFHATVSVEADSTSHRQDERFPMHINHHQTSEAHSSCQETEDSALGAHGRELHDKLRQLQRNKQHVENLVAEFQKLQTAERLLSAGGSGGKSSHNAHAHNTYSSDDSGTDDIPPHTHNGIKSETNLKNEDPFKLMEISAIKAALQKTKDLMRTVERYEPTDTSMADDFQLSHSNINDNKSEGGRSVGDWSTEGSVCRSIRNALPPGKVNNRPHQHQLDGSSHEASINSLQMLATQLRQEAEHIASERQRLQHARNKVDGGSGKVSKKKLLRGSSLGAGTGAGEESSSVGPLERKQMALRAELAEKQRQLEMILNKEKEITAASDAQNMKTDARSYPAMNHSYNSEQEEADSHTDEVMFAEHAHSQPDNHHYQGGVYGEMAQLPPAPAPAPPPAAPGYYSDSDTGSRSKVDVRSHSRRNRQSLAERTIHEHVGVMPESRDLPPPPPPHPPQHLANNGESTSSSPMFPPAMAPPPQQPAWANKSNQDIRSNQFTQNSHSQTTMERLLGAQSMQFPHSVPFNMMMPYGVMGGTGCGCWGPWCWQQLAAQQRDIHQLREQINHLEERWRAETAPHALNNQVPPGNRANNYWDNFRSYSRQNLLSANSKTNADGHLGSVPAHNPHPLVARSHNTLHPSPAPPPPPAPATPPANTPKRNTNRHNLAYEQHNSAQTAPDVLNVNQHVDTELTHTNINRDHSLPERNLNRPEPIPEIIQSHSNNLNRSPESLNTKKKSSSKLPAKNSANRRNYSLDFVQNSNINIVSTSETPNPNLASTSRDKATSKMFDLFREHVYSEVTALISANEAHPEFLVQLFRELQNVSSDSLRQNALQSIRNLSSNVQSESSNAESNSASSVAANVPNEELNQANVIRDGASVVYKNIIDFMLTRGEEICTPDLLEAFKTVIINSHHNAGQTMPYTPKKLQEFLSKYEGMRLRDVCGDIIDDLLSVPTEDENQSRHENEVEQSLQDMAGSLQVNVPLNGSYCWGDGAGDREGQAVSGAGRLDLLECAEMYNGDLAEADQTCSSEAEPAHDTAELLPDVVETEEITPTEAEAEWLGLDRVPTRLHMEDSPARNLFSCGASESSALRFLDTRGGGLLGRGRHVVMSESISMGASAHTDSGRCESGCRTGWKP